MREHISLGRVASIDVGINWSVTPPSRLLGRDEPFGWFLVLLGLAQLLLFAGFGGIWLMLIGWFLTTAAAAEEQHAKVSGALSDVRVRDVMSAYPTVAPRSISVDQFLEDYVFPHRFSTFPLTEESGRPAGLVTRAM